MTIRAGRLEHRITLQRNEPVQSDTGEMTEHWVEIATVWAERVWIRASERFAAQQTLAERVEMFRIRWREDTGPLQRLVWQGRAYDIQSVAPLDRRIGLEITATARAE